MLRTISFLISTLILTASLYAQTIIPGGPVSGTWTYDNSPYLIQGDISIDETSTLEIEPGVDVLFQGYYRLLCEGQLLAIGTEADSITFTAEDTSEGWDGIDFVDLNLNTMDSSRVEYCIISYGVASRRIGEIDFTSGGGVFFLNSGKVKISHSIIERNHTADKHGSDGQSGINMGDDGWPGENSNTGHGGAVYCLSSAPLFVHNTIRFNQTGDAIGGNGGDGAGAAGYNSQVGGDGAAGGLAVSGDGGSIYMHLSSPMFIGNIIVHNSTGTATGGHGGDGGGVTAIGSSAVGRGGSAGNGGDAISGAGAVFYAESSNPTFSNNLITSNYVGITYAGDGGDGGWVTIYNGGIYSEAWGGYGGDGGSVFMGYGAAFYSGENSHPAMNNCTFRFNYHGEFEIGSGGEAGETSGGAWVYPGQPGNPGSLEADNSLITGDNLIVNSIIWENISSGISVESEITYSCVENGFPGIGNIQSDPLFIESYLGTSFLSHIETGQIQQSPCVDSGHPDSSLVEGTTRIDGIADDDVVDMGYHYDLFEPGPVMDISPGLLIFEAFPNTANPPAQFISIDNGWAGYFNYIIEEDIEWLTVTPESGGPVPPVERPSVEVNIENLSTGLYEGEIWIHSEEAINSPQCITVQLFLNILSGNIHDTLLAGEYLIIDNIMVNSVSRLTIEDGVTMLFADSASFTVYGQFDAFGTEEDSIKFLPQLSDLGWNGITVHSAFADTVIMDYCRISGSNDIGIKTTNSNLLISNSVFSDNSNDFAGGGIIADDSYIVLNGCIFQNNNSAESGGGAYFEDCEIFMENCKSNYNTSELYGGAVYSITSTLYMHNCEFANNLCDFSGGGAYLSLSEVSIEKCKFKYNTANLCGGGVYSTNTDIMVKTTLLDNNCADDGGGMFYINYPDSNIQNSISNCSFIDNSSTDNGGALWINSEHILIDNTLFCENTGNNSIFLSITDFQISYSDFHENSQPIISSAIPPEFSVLSTTNSNGDSCDVYNNIFLDPLFVDPEEGNFHLQWGSPCIDAGNPLSPWDPDSTIADIGAYYFDQLLEVETPNSQFLILNYQLGEAYPNPFNSTVRISYAVPSAGEVKLTLYDITGRTVETLLDGWKTPGYYDVSYNPDRLASGIYFLRMSTENFTKTQKVVYLK